MAVKLQAFLMSKTEGAAAEYLHKRNLRPYSLFTVEQRENIIFRLNILTDEALPLYNAALNTRRYAVTGINGGIDVLDTVTYDDMPLSDLRGSAPKQFKLLLASPATYKHENTYSNIFALAPLFFSVADKLRLFFGVDISNAEITALCETLKFVQYNFRSDTYAVKRGNVIPAFSGEFALAPRGTDAQTEKLMLLLRFAEYSGVGAKTALGMGGVLLDEK
ncbi:MAG: CRISPR system precrRNA processing endoribonuclease RAMP protein Cas6 [Oscillospiraceae bacterium]|nr:CRISPR system precrRNA processing endoribonuclease RAMP protein Cas6 [Oscillospiraceae bacterium]